jgi:hypothetical protein
MREVDIEEMDGEREGEEREREERGFGVCGQRGCEGKERGEEVGSEGEPPRV